MAIKASQGKLPFYALLIQRGSDQLMASLRESSFELLPISLHHALTAANLPWHHRDPFDRVLIAQAMIEGLTVITTDAKFALYAGVRLLWA